MPPKDKIYIPPYAGSVCVLEVTGCSFKDKTDLENELTDIKITILQATEECAQELFGSTGTVESVRSLDILTCLDNQFQAILYAAFYDATHTRKKTSCELSLHDVSNTWPAIHVRLNMRFIDKIDSAFVFSCNLENDTDQYESVTRDQLLLKQLQLILQNINGGISAAYIDDDTVKIMYANNEFYSLFGYTESQYKTEIGGTLFNIILPEYLPYIKKALAVDSAQKETIQLEYQVRCRDGSVIWVRSYNSLCYVDSMDRTVHISVFTDITNEKRAEERMKSIVANLGHSEIYIQIDILNKRMEAYYSQYEPDVNIDTLSENENPYENILLSQIYPEDREKALSILSFEQLKKHYKNGDTKLSVEYRRFLPGNTVHWFDATIILMDDIKSKKAEAFIYSSNIDDTVKTRMARECVADQNVSSILIVNIAKKTVRAVKQIVYNNINLAECSYDKVIQRYIEHVVVKEDRARCRSFYSLEKLTAAVKKRGYTDLSYQVSDGSRATARINMHVSFIDNTHEDLLLVTRDITALFEIEQEQKMALQNAVEIANYANQAKSNFLSRMSHDMRTPLNTILGLVELVKNQNTVPNIEEYLNGIDIAGQYLLSLINDTLDLSKIESGKMEFNEELFTLEEFELSVKTVIKPLMDAKNIRFTVNLEQNVQSLIVDKLRFKQIFFNLLSNAAKYTPSGGEVYFLSEAIADKEGKSGIRFRIRDTGIGMGDEYLQNLFLPFSEEKNAVNMEQKGTGLGLVIVKQIVDLMGGTISVTSTLQKGTEFVIDIYARKPEHSAVSHPPATYDASKLHNVRVLLADDTIVNATIVKTLLGYKGCLVDTARNGREAVSLFSASPLFYYDIILTDMRMPVMDGLEEARKIRQLNRADAAQIPIIAATADAYEDTYKKIIDAGMNARLIKPIRPETLFAMIVQLLDNHNADKAVLAE